METLPLREYRCHCGKLLLKGFLLLGVVEIKCRRCGLLYTNQQFEPGLYTFLECDLDFRVTSASEYSYSILGYEPNELLGQPLDTFFPLLRDHTKNHAESKANTNTYRIADNTCLLKDGASKSFNSYLVPRRQAGELVGYSLLNCLAHNN